MLNTNFPYLALYASITDKRLAMRESLATAPELRPLGTSDTMIYRWIRQPEVVPGCTCFRGYPSRDAWALDGNGVEGKDYVVIDGVRAYFAEVVAELVEDD